MTSENRRTLIIETIRSIQIGAPVSKRGVTLLLEPWPDLYWEAMDRVRWTPMFGQRKGGVKRESRRGLEARIHALRVVTEERLSLFLRDMNRFLFVVGPVGMWAKVSIPPCFPRRLARHQGPGETWGKRSRSAKPIYPQGRASLEDLARRSVAQRLMGALIVVQDEPATDPGARLGDRGLMKTSSYLRLRHSRSMKILLRNRPLPSMLMATPCSASRPVKAALVNWLP